MATIECKKCKQKNSEDALYCSGCGTPTTANKNPIKKVLGFLVLGLAALFLISIFGGSFLNIGSDGNSDYNSVQNNETSNSIINEPLIDKSKAISDPVTPKNTTKGNVRTPQPAKEMQPLINDKFELTHSLSGSNLKLKLDTDLPKDTVVSVRVSRSYWEKGRTTEYSKEYYLYRGTLADWDSDTPIVLSTEKWKASLKAFQAETEEGGFGFTVERVSDEVTASIAVSVTEQTNPKFGHRNANLQGKAVIIEGFHDARLAKDEVKFSKPL